MNTEHKPTAEGKVMCKKCNVEVTPKADGTCPTCGSKLS